MKFKTKKGERDFAEKLHPDTKTLLERFDSWSAEAGLPEPVWAELSRDKQDNAEYYVALWLGIQRKSNLAPSTLTREDNSWLDGSRRRDAPPIRGLGMSELRTAALKLFSWHIRHTAADLSLRPYDAAQRLEVQTWFERNCIGERWELLVHKVTETHLHVARRDHSWVPRWKGTDNV